MNNKEDWITEVPDPPNKIRNDPDKLKLWNDYWEKLIQEWQDELEQERRNRRTT